jgi:hypothetical protein
MNEVIDYAFKLTLEGIHLTRNKYTYRLIPSGEIISASLIKGSSVKNWMVILVFGMCLVGMAIYLIYQITIGFSVEDKSIRFYNVFGHGMISVILLGGAGVIAIYSAMRSVPIVKIQLNKKTYNLRILKNRSRVKEILDIFALNGIKIIDEKRP